MLIIETTALSNGAHRNQTYSGTEIPEGWIAVPADMEAEAKACLPFIVLDINDEGILTGVSHGEIPEAGDVTEPVSEADTLMLAITELYESNLALQEENTSVMLAVTELYETMIGG